MEIILAILGTVYVPLWIYQQTVKNKNAKEISKEITDIKILLTKTTTSHGIRLDNHEVRITKLEDEK